MIVVHEGYSASKNKPGISMRDKEITDTIQRVLGTFLGKYFRVEIISAHRGAYVKEGVLDSIHVESVDSLDGKYDALSLVLKTERGLQAVYMGSRGFEPRVANVHIRKPYEGCNEARYFQNVPISKEYDDLILKRLMKDVQ